MNFKQLLPFITAFCNGGFYSCSYEMNGSCLILRSSSPTSKSKFLEPHFLTVLDKEFTH